MKFQFALIATALLLIASTPCFSEGRTPLTDGGAQTITSTPTTLSTTSTATPAALSQKSYLAGDKVQVLWQSKWYPATVKHIEGNMTACIHYDGYANSWDECVTADRIKFPDGSAGVINSASQTVATGFNAGEKVSVLWNGTWYPATVKSTSGTQTCIHYDGYASSWDECVSPDRIKKN